MGTQVTVLAPEAAAAIAGRDIEALFAEWERILSRFQPTSELSRLNAARRGATARREVLVGDLVLAVTRAALAAAEATDGIFDPTLLHALVAEGYDRSFDLLPAARSWTGPTAVPGRGQWRDVRVDLLLRSISLPPGVGLDFGGIAKGMAVDAAVEHLRVSGITPVVVEAGGDLAVHGAPTDGTWPIAVETGSTITNVELDRGAMATSSVAKRRWVVNGEVRHHLLDPHTGRAAATDLLSATVVANTCREAEVAAKCALILGEAAGGAFLDRLGLAGLLVAPDDRIVPIGGWALATGAAA